MVLRKPTGTRNRRFFFLLELFEVKAVLRPNVFRIVGANTKYRFAAPLEQIQPRNFVNRAPISCEEVINLKNQIGEAERYLDNSEKLGVTILQLGEQIDSLTLTLTTGLRNSCN